MLVGHYAVGLVAKRVEPRVSLGTLVFAAMLADFFWTIFMLLGIDHVQFGSGKGAANYIVASNISMSHSLLMNTLWAAVLAMAYWLRSHYPRGAWIIFLAAIGHWLLDFIAHRPDMALAPGTRKYFGLGLWTSIPATLVVEGGFWLLAIIFYVRATRPSRRAGIYVLWIGIVLLTLIWYSNIAGPPPPNPKLAPIVSLIFFSLSVVWAYWVNRLRPARSA